MTDLLETIIDIACAGVGKSPCEVCRKRVGTQYLHDDIYDLLPHNPWVCAECAEAGATRQQERLMQNPPLPLRGLHDPIRTLEQARRDIAANRARLRRPS